MKKTKVKKEFFKKGHPESGCGGGQQQQNKTCGGTSPGYFQRTF